MKISKTRMLHYIIGGASLVLGYISTKLAEKEAQEDLEQKVNAAIVQACVQVGMLEVDDRKED